MNPIRIAVVGSLNADLVVRVNRRPLPGETVLGSDLMLWPGGKGGNQAVAAARMGARVTMIGMVGRDPFADMLLQSLESDGVDTQYVFRSDGSSGTAQIVVDESGQNSIVVSPGANARLVPEVLEKAVPALLKSDWILTQLEIPDAAVSWLAEFSARHGKKLLLNPAPARAIAPGVLRSVSLFVPNESEAEFYTGLRVESPENAEQAADRLHAAGIPEVIITLGSKGAFWSSGDKAHFVPAYGVQAVDTTAAGDCFIGSLAALAAGGVNEKALKGACAAAALSVTRPGAQPSMPTGPEVERFLTQGR